MNLWVVNPRLDSPAGVLGRGVTEGVSTGVEEVLKAAAALS